MAGTGKTYLADDRQRYEITTDKAKALVDSPYLSAAVAVTATGATKVFDIPEGAYVSNVGLVAQGAVTSTDIDLGFAADTDYFIDGVTALATAGNVVMAPIPTVAAATSAIGVAPLGDRYFSAATPMILTVNATGAGSVKVIADIKYPE